MDRKTNKIIQKLRSRRGASFLIAMMVFLVATFVSVVIITTAVTAVKRVKDDSKQTASQLAVSSASRLVADCLRSSSVTVTEVETRSALGTEPETYDVENATYYEGSGDFGNILENLIREADGPVYSPDTEYQLSVPVPEGTEMPECILTLKINPKQPFGGDPYPDDTDIYKITGTMTSKEETTGSRIFVTAVLQDIPVGDETVDGETTTRVREYVWSNVEMTSTR